MRPHIAAIYAFARSADDFADEGERTDYERLCLLDDWQRRLRELSQGRPSAQADDDGDMIFSALSHTIDSFELPIGLFEDLLSAFRQDVTVYRYNTWEELLDYCRRSANPIGRLVLRIAGCWHVDSERSSDCVCSGLQIANFLQDFARDWERGHLYIPVEIYSTYGAREQDLGQPYLVSEWREAVSDLVGRTRKLLYQGRSVCDYVQGPLKYEVRATWLGGARILDRLEWTGYDPVVRRPAISAVDYFPLLWQMLTWQSTYR